MLKIVGWLGGRAGLVLTPVELVPLVLVLLGQLVVRQKAQVGQRVLGADEFGERRGAGRFGRGVGGQGRGVQKPQVGALPRQGMDGMGGITDQGNAWLDVLLCVQALQRPAATLNEKRPAEYPRARAGGVRENSLRISVKKPT